ncbi:Oidioi.mRNA.OKI2018_I69.XSR.g15033.t1.cds [Oikopleura dioica]|uniref:Oidioi.mRNA.OKI2018_I69.XSR.g15033.t1.cds n=1 Tax=Oikopleura dioica TaxID=34765 RepID=A0ABN7SFI6_OIKDI|nr:Oidioi.mRNA.OKI2018_I69.XSR.g15033.t1.cds [Oikopleura dioica]
MSVLDEFLPRHVSEKRNKVCFDDEDSDEEESDSDSTDGLESNDSDEHEVTNDGDFEFDEVYVPGQHDGTYTEYVAEDSPAELEAAAKELLELSDSDENVADESYQAEDVSELDEDESVSDEEELNLESERWDKFRLPEEEAPEEDPVDELANMFDNELSILGVSEDEYAALIFSKAWEEQLRLVKEGKNVDFSEDNEFLQFWEKQGQMLTWKNIVMKQIDIEKNEVDFPEQLTEERRSQVEETWNESADEVYAACQLYWSSWRREFNKTVGRSHYDE